MKELFACTDGKEIYGAKPGSVVYRHEQAHLELEKSSLFRQVRTLIEVGMAFGVVGLLITSPFELLQFVGYVAGVFMIAEEGFAWGAAVVP